MDLGILRVTTPDGQVREYPLDVSPVFIGRAEGNRVVIDHVSVSRRHARLDFEGGQVQLEDLSSATGTYVGGQRLAPGSPMVLAAGQAVRIGDCQAILVSAGAGAGSGGGGVVPAGTPAGGPAPGGGGGLRPEQAVAIWITPPTAPIAPGSAGSATVTIQNRSNVVDTVSLAIHGVPPEWVRITRGSVQLLPDAREEVVVVIQPPRDTSAWAGEYEFAAAATSAQHRVEVRSLAKITVLPFGNVSLELRPARSRRVFTAVVTNESNSPIAAPLECQDEQGEVAASFTPAEVTLDPGAQANVRVEASLRNGHFFGAEERYPFTVQASVGARNPVASGELIYRPAWLMWRWIVALLLLVAVAVGAWFAYNAFAGGDDDASPGGETPTSQPTETPGPGTPTSSAPTATPSAAATTPTGAGGMAPGTIAVVTNSPENNCLLVRKGPTRVESDPLSERVARLCDGARVTIVGERVEAEGFYWYPIRTADGIEGWSAEGLISGGPRFLTPAS